MLRLTFVDDHGLFVFRRYLHPRRGVVETLTRGNVIHIRPGFGGATQSSTPSSKPKKRRANRERTAYVHHRDQPERRSVKMPTLVRDTYNTNLTGGGPKRGATPWVLTPAKRPQRLSKPQQNHIVAPCAEKAGD